MSKEHIIDAEYEELFPFEQEYNEWVNSIEKDFQEECEYLASLNVDNRTNIFED
jgi:hypothetical protein